MARSDSAPHLRRADSCAGCPPPQRSATRARRRYQSSVRYLRADAASRHARSMARHLTRCRDGGGRDPVRRPSRRPPCLVARVLGTQPYRDHAAHRRSRPDSRRRCYPRQERRSLLSLVGASFGPSTPTSATRYEAAAEHTDQSGEVDLPRCPRCGIGPVILRGGRATRAQTYRTPE